MTGTLARAAVRAAGQQRLPAGDVCPVPVSAFSSDTALRRRREQQPGVDAAELGTLYHEAGRRFTGP